MHSSPVGNIWVANQVNLIKKLLFFYELLILSVNTHGLFL